PALREVIDRSWLDLVHHLNRSVHRRSKSRKQSVDSVRGNADDGEFTPAQSKLSPDHVAIAAERRHPIAVSKYHDGMRAASNGVAGTEQPTHDRRNSDEGEKLAVHQLAGERFDMISEIARKRRELGESNLREDAA